MYYEGQTDDDRYRRGVAGSDISTSRGGMSMVAGGSSSWHDAYCARIGEADGFCSFSYSRMTSKEAR